VAAPPCRVVATVRTICGWRVILSFKCHRWLRNVS
jgi:hypothetical protein